MILVDTHAHLDALAHEGALPGVMARAREAGVAGILAVGVDLESSRRATALAETYPGVYAAVGIHPHEADKVLPQDLEELTTLSAHARVVAIGETGLDYYRNLSSASKQLDLFQAHLRLARDMHKPVIVHDRQAHDQVLSVLRQQSAGLQGVLHCFSGDLDMAEQAVQLGMYISFAGPVTFLNARQLHAVVPRISAERILIETDSPYLAPHPYRGQRNEPSFLTWTARRVADLRGLALDDLAEITTANAMRLFGISEPSWASP